MATTSYAVTPATMPFADGVLVNDIQNMFARIKQAHTAWVTRRELGKLSNRELADIGLSRKEIDDIASRITVG